NQKNYKKDNFYIISIEIVFFHLSRYFMSRTLFYLSFGRDVSSSYLIKGKNMKKFEIIIFTV
ncbi:hypothetical protein, partial [Staphylococcus hominis]